MKRRGFLAVGAVVALFGGITRQAKGKGVFTGDLTLPDGMKVAPGQIILKGWLLRDPEGSLARNLALTNAGGCEASPFIQIPDATQGFEIAVWARIVAPTEPGTYRVEYDGPTGLYAQFEVVVEFKKTPMTAEGFLLQGNAFAPAN